jgi:DNA-binding beta-propeller fold protein YncE
MGGKEIMVINTNNNQVVDSIEVGNEPESMVLDKNGKLWVLCNGGWKRDNFAKLVTINISNNKVQQEFVFPTKEASPTCLKIDAFGQTLYYLDKGVRKMDINLGKLPANVHIAESGTFYKIDINPVNGDIFISDVVDYSQNGYVQLYKNDGTFVTKERAGIIPGSMCFKLIY